MPDPNEMHGGHLVAETLRAQGVRHLFTLCGGHISPILVGAEAQGIRVVDTRHEVTAVFAADATARLTGIPGVAAVTAGPGVTNTITALKNAQMAQSPVVLIGGAAATLLKGRGALQDIDHLALVKSLVKWSDSVSRVRDIVPTLEKAFTQAQHGVPGPVFVEIPIDLLYPESVVREWTLDSARGSGLAASALRAYLKIHMRRVFGGAWANRPSGPAPRHEMKPSDKQVEKVAAHLRQCDKPVLIIGSQALLDAERADRLREAVLKLGIPTYLSGMARGLLGHDSLHLRHQRRRVLRDADTVILAGVPCDFRLGYGQVIPRGATLISLNRSQQDLTQNRRPDIGILTDPGTFLRRLGRQWGDTPEEAAAGVRWRTWHEMQLHRQADREADIDAQAAVPTEYVNPVWLCRQLDEVIDDDSILIGDGGDFVATASYTVRPRNPLSWLDPGAFGTLGPGGGFALAAKLNRPSAEVWLLYGDGSAGYSLAEFDTFARHDVPVIAVIGNDASWAQIARDQVEILGTSLGTDLAQTAYHVVAQGYGALGICVDKPEDVPEALRSAKLLARSGKPVVVNIMIGKTDFRKGSISM